MEDICAVILAAGQGSRFQAAAGAGQDKLMANCRGLDGRERPLLEQVLVNLQGVVGRRLLVTRPERSEVIALARAYGCEVLTLDSPGMGDSIAAAVRASFDQAGWLVLLGDMPFIAPQTIAQIAASITDEKISVADYAGEYGHPVGFGRSFARRLAALSGDRGGRHLFDASNLQVIGVEDPGVIRDVDTPAALNFEK
ncbi:nucleotidyltransferase family protein [Pseudomonas sp. LS1212]|uniref:nucleotidyltransferase family protein n=1 Tax=Pseudomonas sp. LS1212 TaxID=2972478 RepID=UPI00215CAF8D|nr:nucleotidyltransferase family protein [Pseudomonas sp. LS1212]UVJ42707.1 nucleotidyltransferase family protein [Pseudomonas sp. LS1212]